MNKNVNTVQMQYTDSHEISTNAKLSNNNDLYKTTYSDSQLKVLSINQMESNSNEIKNCTKGPTHSIKLNKMFRKLTSFNSSIKPDKLKRDKPNKFEKRPSITVINKTATKNNVKLFLNDDDDLQLNLSIQNQINGESTNSPDDLNNNLSINQSNLSINQSINSNDFIIKDHTSNDYDTNLSSLPIDQMTNLTNRKIEDVRSRSETKLTNCQRKQTTNLKSESFYYLESQSKNQPILDPLSNKVTKVNKIKQKDGHSNQINSKIYKKHLKASREKEELNFQNKKLIAESLLKSNHHNIEMNALLNSQTDSTKPDGSINNINKSNTASHKIPSYIGISCAISGYSTYSKFTNSSESNSPNCLIRRLNDPTLNLDNKSSQPTNSLKSNLINVQSTLTKPNGQFLDTNRTIESYNSFKNNLNRFNNLSNHVNHTSKQPIKHLNTHSTNTHHLNSLNHNVSNHINQSNHFDSLDNSFLIRDHRNDSSQSREDDDSKSLIQKRIESLYGHNFASNWKDKQDKFKFRGEKMNNDSFRSPSCPPEFITNGFVSSKKNLPVLKFIQNMISNSDNIEIKVQNKDEDNMKKDTDTKSTKSQIKSEETISFKTDSNEKSLLNSNDVESNDLNSLIDFDKSIDECKIDSGIVIQSDNITKENELMTPIKIENVSYEKNDDILTSNNDDLLLLDKQDDDQGIDEIDNINFHEIINNQINEKSDEEIHNGKWYLKKLDIEINRINDKISQIEAIGLDENLDNHDEIDGKIRASVGKGHLLINQKLSQFKELCHKNMNQSDDEPYKTLNEDLEGFYEMVSYQIDDVLKTFDEILFLKNNNWIVHNELLSPSPRKSKNSAKSSSNASSRNNSKPSSRNQSKEDLRKKLREAKKRHQNSNPQSNSDDIVIFLPNNKNEIKPDDL